jgi:rhodanese-related sulfurtransferase
MTDRRFRIFSSMSATTTALPRLGVNESASPRAVKRARRPGNLAIESPEAMALKRRRKASFIDLRDWETLDKTGWIEGSLHCPPGEFAAIVDPASPLHARLFEPDVTLIFYGGPKSGPLNAARRARAHGVKDAMALRGGLSAWRRAGGKTTGHPASAIPILKTSLRIMAKDVGMTMRIRAKRLRRRIARLLRAG